ncbi:biosynthetic peptidoglycan transglycosylase [Mesorhizobium abyssinicae]|uniref:biosynthetic peptidoglycan transglycosylase n=1 Tax=Mesorhizobium abyssinicae TaxID=1209958 RepID=UPI002A2404C4|nr:biosynthetic peptidoglycan transglycosylase [Mesorhizobium abyssinicae]MDX8435341.1 biosynthetic peptidoglycan transglycosylase [Mesorhizobium abyssinicae]
MRTDAKSIPSLKNKLINLNNELDDLYDRYLDYDTLPPLDFLEKMTIILEDRRYFTHLGVDIRSVIRELWRKFTFQRHGGASTIEMQFVRTVNNRKELTAYRKFREAVIAVLANYHFNKIALLRSYLDIAFFGSGIIGRNRASEVVYGKSPYGLTPKEAAVIASMLVYPRPLVETDAWRKKIERRSEYALRLLPRFEKMFDKIVVS